MAALASFGWFLLARWQGALFTHRSTDLTLPPKEGTVPLLSSGTRTLPVQASLGGPLAATRGDLRAVAVVRDVHGLGGRESHTGWHLALIQLVDVQAIMLPVCLHQVGVAAGLQKEVNRSHTRKGCTG